MNPGTDLYLVTHSETTGKFYAWERRKKKRWFKEYEYFRGLGSYGSAKKAWESIQHYDVHGEIL